MARRASRLGWIGPVIVIAGIAVAIVMLVYWRRATPVPGDEIARIGCPLPDGDTATVVIRAERGGERSFVEVHTPPHGSATADRVLWQALIPHYAGTATRPAAACGAGTISVRVERSGRAEVFGLELSSGAKLGGYRIATEHEPIRTEPTGPITLTDHVRSYEIVGGAGWHQLVAVDLASGEGLWKVDLGPDPVSDGGVAQGQVWIRQGVRERSFAAESGRESPVTLHEK